MNSREEEKKGGRLPPRLVWGLRGVSVHPLSIDIRFYTILYINPHKDLDIQRLPLILYV